MNELTRLAEHVRSEQERAPHASRLREGILQEIRRQGSITVTRHVIQEMFPHPDQTENFFLASSGCRPVAEIQSQLETWCANNGLFLRYTPHDEILLIVHRVIRPEVFGDWPEPVEGDGPNFVANPDMEHSV